MFWLKQQKFILTFLEAEKFKIKALAHLVSSGNLLLGLQMAEKGIILGVFCMSTKCESLCQLVQFNPNS